MRKQEPVLPSDTRAVAFARLLRDVELRVALPRPPR